MKKMYRARYWDFLDNPIDEMEVVKETAKQIVYLDSVWNDKKVSRREFRSGKDHSYHDTWQEARAALIERADSNIKQAQAKLQRQIARRSALLDLKEPTDG